MNKRTYSFFDTIVDTLDKRLETCFGAPVGTGRSNPAEAIDMPCTLSDKQKSQAAQMMRVNHVGEVCAQALYQGQALTCRRPETREQLSHAAEEENDHLRWCAERLEDLGSHKSYLNPAWYAGALCIGVGAGIAGDRWNLGFLAQTEQQVVEHLTTHLEKLPVNDLHSRAIVEQMRDDESAHATCAMDAGGCTLPAPIPSLMRNCAKIMTTIAKYI